MNDGISPPGDGSLPLGGRARTLAPLAPVASRQTAVPLAGRERIAWRLAALTLILRSCHGRSATIEQLHVLMWSLRDAGNTETLQRAWNDATGRTAFRAYDPLLDDTLSLARAVGLVEQLKTGRIKLSELGARVANRIRDEVGLMDDERRALADLGNISESNMWKRLGTPDKTSGGR
jgi:hypothetical protein